MLDNLMKNIIVLDTETTGVDSTDEIIEFCSTIPSDDVLSTVVYRFNPTKLIPAEASCIHFISNFDLETEEPFNGDKSTEIMKLIDSRVYIVGHNLGFDMDMLINNFTRTGKFTQEEIDLLKVKERRICTLELAKKLYAEDSDFKNLTLSYLWFKLNLHIKHRERNITPHKAEDDVFMCLAVLLELTSIFIDKGMIDISKDIGEQLNVIATTPLVYKKMPFGKHKGEFVSDVPSSYLNWLVLNSEILDENKPNFDVNFAATVSHELSKRAK